MNSIEDIQIKTIECNVINGRKISVKAGIEFGVTVFNNENIDFITGIEEADDIQTLVSPCDISSLIGYGESKTVAKENIQIQEGDSLSEILNVNINIVNKDMKISFNKVLAKGDVEVKVLYLNQMGEIKSVTQNIQIMGFVDMNNVDEECICNMRYKIKNILVKQNSSEDNSIYVEVEIELTCMAYKNYNISVIEDLYGINNNISFNQKNVKVISKKINYEQEFNLRKDLNIPNNEIYNVTVNPVINNTKLLNNRINYEGDVELNILTLDENNRIQSIIQKVPFSYNIDIDGINENSNLDTEVEIRNSNFNVISGGQLDANIDMSFKVDVGMCSNINVIEDINVDEVRYDVPYSMIIYFVKPGDTLWSIAKKFKTTVQDIMRVNEIQDENKIYPGEQLFVPKYVCTKKKITA